jgi:hypothetical protein
LNNVLGGNPITNIDFISDIWKTKSDKEKADEINSELNIEKQKMQKQIIKLETKLSQYKEKSNTDKATSTEEKVNRLERDVVVDYNSIAILLHELTHVKQVIDGRLEAPEVNGIVIAQYHDIWDEVEAYTRQYWYNPIQFTTGVHSDRPFLGYVDFQFVYGIYYTYTDIYGEQKTKHLYENLPITPQSRK